MRLNTSLLPIIALHQQTNAIKSIISLFHHLSLALMSVLIHFKMPHFLHIQLGNLLTLTKSIKIQLTKQ